jgi:23S rRNA (guanosine2251-2'-O)-methyltransferase
MTRSIVLILHNIRSVYNVGAIFRTADAAGVSEIILTGYTPIPLDRFGRIRRDFKKTALGAEATMPWRMGEEIQNVLDELTLRGFMTVALEQDIRAVTYTKFVSKNKVALVVGNEVEGVPHDVLDTCEAVIDIPMRGKKESLNVSVAARIVLYELTRQ